jgi:hypothetical protein
MNYYPEEDDDLRQRPSATRKALGILGIFITGLVGAVAILSGSIILGAFFSVFPACTGCSSQASGVLSSIPTNAFIALYITVGGLVLVIIYSIYRVVFQS